MKPELINTADLTALLQNVASSEAIARKIEGVEGYTLIINLENRSLLLSTYLTNKPRLFKRADALLKEAKNLGLNSVIFPI